MTTTTRKNQASDRRRDRLPQKEIEDENAMDESAGLKTGVSSHFLMEEFEYARKPRRLLRQGRVFAAFWIEPGSAHSTARTIPFYPDLDVRVFSEIRRFIVVHESLHAALCVPIHTYGGLGIKKKGIRLEDHAKIYRSGDPPPAIQEGLRLRDPIEIIVEDSSSIARLHPASVVDFGRIYTIEHHVKLKNIGIVNREHNPRLNVHWILSSPKKPTKASPTGPMDSADTRMIEVRENPPTAACEHTYGSAEETADDPLQGSQQTEGAKSLVLRLSQSEDEGKDEAQLLEGHQKANTQGDELVSQQSLDVAKYNKDPRGNTPINGVDEESQSCDDSDIDFMNDPEIRHLNNVNNEIKTLFIKVSEGETAAVHELLEIKADSRISDRQYCALLQDASCRGYRDIVELLLKHRAVDTSGVEYGAALQAASAEGFKAIVELLLQFGGASLIWSRTYGPAMQAASSRGKRDIVDLLLYTRANSRSTDERGAAGENTLKSDHEDFVQLLLDVGADDSLCSSGPNTTMHKVYNKSLQKFIQLLTQTTTRFFETQGGPPRKRQRGFTSPSESETKVGE